MAAARPIPEEAPVTTTILPSNCIALTLPARLRRTGNAKL
jgi:hypothetical protein